VQDADHNTTRFIILSRHGEVPEMVEGQTYLTSFIFRVRNIPAALYKALGGFATNNVNMVKLESYVNPRFEVAQFYADVVAHPDQRKLQLAMDELKFFAEEITVLGTYPTHAFRAQ
jgi:prephenate dehydratase